ncbi:MAG: hypothetical protein ACR2OG_00955 [Gemmatimonadaceae bacterium]
MVGISGRHLPRLVFLMTALAGTACSDANPTGPLFSANARASASAGAQRLPIKGTSISVAVLDFNPPAGRCPASHPVLVTVRDVFQLSHLGRTLDVQSHCIEFGPGSDPNFVATTLTFTAANGDKLYGTYTGTIVPIIPASGPPTEATVNVQITFSGGTGRFTGATGELTGAGIQVFFAAATINYDGWITY